MPTFQKWGRSRRLRAEWLEAYAVSDGHRFRSGRKVIPTSWFTDHAIRTTEASKNGVYYTTANGVKVYNKGEKTLTMCHFEGSQKRDMTFQVADVNKALGSANKIVRNGNRIVMDLDDEGHDYSYIESKSTGERLWLRESEGVYVLDMLVAPAPAAVAPPDPGFTGRGR